MLQLATLQKRVKLIGLGFLLVLILVVTVFVGREASRVLVKAASCPAGGVSAKQVTVNSAIISWDTTDASQGRVEYGTAVDSLAFSVPEGSADTAHNVPLTLLTPNTVYYYIITIGTNKCDSTGQRCREGSCVPWSFTTAAAAALSDQVVATLTPAPPTPTSASTTTRSATATRAPGTTGTRTTTTTPGTTRAVARPLAISPTSGLGAYCRIVKANVGAASSDTKRWTNVKQYDIDANNVINGLDVFKCAKSGK